MRFDTFMYWTQNGPLVVYTFKELNGLIAKDFITVEHIYLHA